MLALSLSQVILIILALAALIVPGGFAVASWREGERRAARVAALIALVGGFLFAVAVFLPEIGRLVVLVLVGLGTLLAVGGFFLPIAAIDMSRDVPLKRVDERDIMFARAHLTPGSPQYQAYYAMRPQNKANDDQTRGKPGLLSLDAELADPYLFAAPAGSFTLTEAMHAAVDGEVASQQHTLPPDQMTAYIKDLARYFGALDVGITELKPYHIYSHIGRGSGEYGAPVELNHRYAIAFTVEMDFEMIGANPLPAGVIESARQYVEAGRVAVQLAAAIRSLGYAARAHMDGDYRVICPLVARDAGLGEIGRMGLLMTPRQGPRVRVNVVTTDLPLLIDQPTRDAAVVEFCTLCQKCALNCPVRAIPFGPRLEIAGALRWQINADTCFRYWNVVGTDCGRCMAVCPFSHADNFYHNLVRWGIARSGIFRRLALRLEDLFYGEKPAPREAPAWTRHS
jgi:reductive dehalogenase